MGSKSTAVAKTAKVSEAQIIKSMLNLKTDEEKSRFMSIMYQQMRRPEIQKCNRGSIVDCCRTLSLLGLEPDPFLQLVYIIPFGGKATIVMDYKGRIELAERTGKVRVLKVGVVYQNDIYEHYFTEKGVHFKHDPCRKDEKGVIVAAYTAWEFRDTGRVLITEIGEHELNMARNASRSKDKADSVWKKDMVTAWKKTAVHNASKILPKSREMMIADDLEEKGETDTSQSSKDYLPEDIDDAQFETMFSAEVLDADSFSTFRKDQDIDDAKTEPVDTETGETTEISEIDKIGMATNFSQLKEAVLAAEIKVKDEAGFKELSETARVMYDTIKLSGPKCSEIDDILKTTRSRI